MKTKGSFILKASTALVLALLMLFGTVSTAFAVVVDQADTGAEIDFADTGYDSVEYDKFSLGYNNAFSGSTAFNSSGWATVTATATGTLNFHFYVPTWTNNKEYNDYRDSVSINADGTERQIYRHYDNDSNTKYNTLSVTSGKKYAFQLTYADTNSIKFKVFNVISFAEDTVLYFDFSTWWTNTTCYEYAELFKADGSKTVLKLNNLSSYTTSSTYSSAGTASNTVYFCQVPAGDYLWLENLYRMKSDSITIDYYNKTDATKSLSLTNNKNSTSFNGDNYGNFAFDTTKLEESTASLTASQNTVEVRNAITLTPSINYTALNAKDGDSYSVTLNGASATSGTDYTLVGNTFTPLNPGEFVITDEISYHAKGYASLSDASSASVTITATSTLPYITSFVAGAGSIDVGKSTTLTVTAENYGSCTTTYAVYTDSGCTTDSTSGTGYSISPNGTASASSATFTGLKSGTYYIKATISDGTNSDTYVTAVSVGVNPPTVTFSNLTNLDVNSTTPLAADSITNAPAYYEYEYALDDAFTITENNYIKLVDGSIVALQPTGDSPGAQTIYWRMKAGVDEEHITVIDTTVGGVTEAYHSFTATVAAPTMSIAYPTTGDNILTEDTSKVAAMDEDNLDSYGLEKTAVTWEVSNELDASSAAAEGKILSVNATTGAITPKSAGSATLTATVVYNEKYTATYSVTGVTVNAPTLEAPSDVYVYINNNSDSAKRAMDYTDTVTFKVTSNAFDADYAGVTKVMIDRKDRTGTEFTVTPDYPALATQNDQTVTVVADDSDDLVDGRYGTYQIYAMYFVNDVEIRSLRKTINLHIMPYEEMLTIYFNDGNLWGTITDGSGNNNIGVYTYWGTGADEFRWVKNYYNGYENESSSYSDYMTPIGTAGSNRVYAGLYRKLDLIGSLDDGNVQNLLFNGNGKTFSSDNWKQTVDVEPDEGKKCFDNYTYFQLNGEYASDNKKKVDKHNYGCLKPTNATISATNPAMPNNGTTTVSFSIASAGYTYGETAANTGYYEIAISNTTVFANGLTTSPKEGNIADISATAHNSNYGDSVITGWLYFRTASAVLTAPAKTDAARNFIAKQLDPMTLTVTDVKSKVHLLTYRMDAGTYSQVAETVVTATGTYGGNTYTNQGPETSVDYRQNDIAATVTLGHGDLDGYTFVGYHVVAQTGAEAPAAPTASTSITSSLANYSFSTNVIRNDSGYKSDYYVYALFRKDLAVSAGKSYSYNQASGVLTYTASAPKTITVERDGAVVATYTFNASAAAGTVSALDANNKGTFGENGEIPVLDNDVVTLTYSALASSDKISTIHYNNSVASDQLTYVNTPAYQEMVENTDCTINQTDHSVSFTVADSRKHITIELGTKHRITFKTNTSLKEGQGYETTGMNIGGYYADGESISFDIAAERAATCAYEFGTVEAYDNAGEPVTGINYNHATGKITGTMPAFDVIIDLHITIKYSLYFETKVLSDVVDSKTQISNYVLDRTNGGSLTATYGETQIQNLDAVPTDNNLGPKSDTTGSVINAGDSVVYSIDMKNTSYQFLGWYKSDVKATKPDLEKGFVSAKTTVSFKPSANVKIWAVATRNFFIAGNFVYSEKTGAIAHKPHSEANNTTFTYAYPMSYDTEENAYAITFNSFNKLTTYVNDIYEAEGNVTEPFVGTRITKGKNTSGSLGYADYGEIYLFKCYSDSAMSSATHWHNITNYKDSYIGYGAGGKQTSDHIYYGQTYGDSGYGMFDFTGQTTTDGYDVPVTLYFIPGGTEGSSKWYIKATRVLPDIYVSNGYEKIDNQFTNSTNTVVKHNDTTLTATATDTAPTREGDINTYKAPTKNAVITLEKELSGSNYTDYEVSHFVVYNLATDKVKAYATEEVAGESKNTYTAEIQLSYDSLYIVPVIQYCGTNPMTVYFNSTQLDTYEWGDLVSCYAWYQLDGGTTVLKDGGNDVGAYGSYPGQVMVPSDDGKSWSARFRPTTTSGGSDYTLAGITFANYYDDSKFTWFNSDHVGSGKLITQYNSIERSNNAAFNKKNCKTQTYDYREPIAMFENLGVGEEAVLSFAIKTGNTNYLTVSKSDNGPDDDPDYENNLEDMNVLTAKNPQGKKKYEPSFEYLTDASGLHYVDLNGNVLNDQPTPSFYVIAKGMITYDNGSILYEFKTGNEKDEYTSGQRTYDVAGVEMVNAVQWYIYDASGNYIDDVLSAAYSDGCKLAANTSAVYNATSTQPIVAKRLENLGYAVAGKSVAISYDYPRMCYTNKNLDDTFDTYRFIGQWYKTSNKQPVTVDVEVGVLTESGPEFPGSNSAPYGKAEASYDREKGNPTFLSEVDGDAEKSYITTAIGDAPNSPIKLSANNDETFDGWYYYDSDGVFQLASKDLVYYPAYSGNSTYYAMYKIVSSYMFVYYDRNGKELSYTVSVELNSNEIKGYAGNNFTPNVPTFKWNAMSTEEKNMFIPEGGGDPVDPYTKALQTFKNKIKVYQNTSFTWPTTPAPDSLYADADLNACVAKATPTATTYTVTYYEGNHTTSHAVTPITANDILTFTPGREGQAGFHYAGQPTAQTYDGNAFSYWSSDPAGAEPLTANINYGLIVNHDMTIYPQYGKPLAELERWIPTVEKDAEQSRQIITGSDTILLDYDLYFVNTIGEMIDELPDEDVENIHYGLALVYQQDDPVTTDPSLDGVKVKQYIKALVDNNRSSGRGGGHYITVVDNNNKEYISNRNRSHYTIKLNGKTQSGYHIGAYAYVYDKRSGDMIFCSAKTATNVIVSNYEFV